MAAQDFPHADIEVIVVDDGSVPAVTGADITPWGDTLAVTLVRQRPAGAAAARNYGARLARGTWLGFTDDDCRPAPTWLTTLAAAASVYPAHALGGRTINALPDNPYATASQLVVDHLLPVNDAGPNSAHFLASNNLAVPASPFRHMGGFDTVFGAAGGEDRAFCDDWRASGYDLIYLPAAIVWHAHTLNLRTFWRQHIAYGRGAFHYHTRSAATHHLEPVRFYVRLLTSPFTRHLPHPAALTGLLLLAQVATAAGFVHAMSATARKNVR